MIRLSDVKVQLQYRWRVRQRLMVLHFARLHGPTAAGRRFGVSVRTIRRWRARWRQGGLGALVPRYPARRGRRVSPRAVELVGHARRELAYGAQRTQLWLRRVHNIRIAVGTVQRIFRDLGLPRLRRTRKRVPRQMRLFEKAEPGESVQVDVKFVKIAGRWAFQYTALDDCTRYRVLRLYRRLHQQSSLAFLAELRRGFPFRIRKLQCDNGREFPLEFVLAVHAAGIRHRYIRPRRRSRTARWSGAIASTRRNSGAVSASPTLTRRPPRCAVGSIGTTTTDSHSLLPVAPRRRSWPPCSPPPRPDANARRMTTAGQVNLDETQHSRRPAR